MDKVTFNKAISPFACINDIFTLQIIINRLGTENIEEVALAVSASQLRERQWTRPTLKMAVERLQLLWPRIGMLNEDLKITMGACTDAMDRCISLPHIKLEGNKACPKFLLDVRLWSYHNVTLYCLDGPRRAKLSVFKCHQCDIRLYQNIISSTESWYDTQKTLKSEIICLSRETAFHAQLLLSVDADL